MTEEEAAAEAQRLNEAEPSFRGARDWLRGPRYWVPVGRADGTWRVEQRQDKGSLLGALKANFITDLFSKGSG